MTWRSWLNLKALELDKPHYYINKQLSWGLSLMDGYKITRAQQAAIKREALKLRHGCAYTKVQEAAKLILKIVWTRTTYSREEMVFIVNFIEKTPRFIRLTERQLGVADRLAAIHAEICSRE